MNTETTHPLHELLAASLEAWKVDGAVKVDADGALLLTWSADPDRPLRIARAPAGLPFRWQVTYAGRTRSAASVVGVLRTVRSVIDPQFAGMKVKIGA